MALHAARHMSYSLVNQEAVTDQRCPNATTNSTATKLAIPTQGRRIHGLFALLQPQAY
jgi:hypothetical protein